MPMVRPLMALRNVSLNVPAPAGDSLVVCQMDAETAGLARHVADGARCRAPATIRRSA